MFCAYYPDTALRSSMGLESQLRYSDHDARVNGLRRTAGIQIFVLRNATIAHRIGYIAAAARYLTRQRAMHANVLIGWSDDSDHS